MKKIAVALLVSMVSLFGEVSFIKDYQKAVEKAKAEDKKIMIMLTKEKCQACWYMKHVTFKDSDLAQMIDDNFVSVEVDVDKDMIPMNLEYIGTPTFYFLDKAQDQLSRVDGARNVKKFRERIDFIIH